MLLSRRCLASPRVLSALAAGAFGVACSAFAHERAHCQTKRGVSPAVHAELEKLRPGEAAMRRKWEEDEDKWHKLPPRAWPPYYPSADEVAMLRQRLVEHTCPSAEEIVAGGVILSKECISCAFDLATCLTFNGLDADRGLRMYIKLALDKGKDASDADGDAESMVAVGVVLLEGLGVPRDEAEGLRWLRRGAAAGSVQGEYELAVAYYTGLDEAGLECDEAQAFKYFESAASRMHTGALFMLADCLIEGTGCEKDPARAVPLLHAAAIRGHRLARAYLREWLDEDAETFNKLGLLRK